MERYYASTHPLRNPGLVGLPSLAIAGPGCKTPEQDLHPTGCCPDHLSMGCDVSAFPSINSDLSDVPILIATFYLT